MMFRIIIFISLFFVANFSLNAQPLSVWHQMHKADYKDVNFSKVKLRKGKFTLVQEVDTVSIPKRKSILLLDKSGAFVRSLDFDTAVYTYQEDLIIVGKRKNSKLGWGLSDLKGEMKFPADYSNIRMYKDYVALRNEKSKWALFELKGKQITSFIYDDLAFTDFGKVLARTVSGQGVLLYDGTVFIDIKYESIVQFSEDSFLLKEPSEWSMIDNNNNASFSWLADSVKALNDSIYLHYHLGFIKVRDSLGTVIGNENGYRKVEVLKDGLLKVGSNGSLGVITFKGNEILPMKFYAIDLCGDFLKVLEDEVKVLRYRNVVNKGKQRWGLYDTLGNNVAMAYRTIKDYAYNRLAVEVESGLWGFLNEKGVLVVPAIYESVTEFKDGFSLVTYKEKYKLIDTVGQVIFSDKEAQLYYYGVIKYRECASEGRREGEPEVELYYGVPPNRYDEYAVSTYGFIRVKNGKYTGVLDAEGHEVVFAYQDTIYAVSEDSFFLYKRADGRIGYSDQYGNKTLDLMDKYKQVQPLKNGYSRFTKDGLYGFIDAYGNVPIAPKYSQCQEFSDGMAAVHLKNKWGFIDKSENLLVQPYYKEVQPFRNGFAPVKNNSNKWIFIDKAGKSINTTMYDSFYEIEGGYYIVRKGQRWGVTYPNGKEILSPKYERIEMINAERIKIKKDGKFGVMDFQENIILYYKYDGLIYNPYLNCFFVMEEGVRRKIRKVADGR